MVGSTFCNFPVRPGRCRPGISGSHGMMSNESATYKKSSTTADSFCCLGSGSRILQVQRFLLLVRQIQEDWQRCYDYRPVLMESLVDTRRFKGTCYKAANWIHVGTTTGRGRMDRYSKRKGMEPKEIYLYPLASRFREELLA